MFHDLPDDSFSLFFFFFFWCFSMFSPFPPRVAFLFYFTLLLFGKLVDWIYVETGDTEDCKDLKVLGIPLGE